MVARPAGGPTVALAASPVYFRVLSLRIGPLSPLLCSASRWIGNAVASSRHRAPRALLCPPDHLHKQRIAATALAASAGRGAPVPASLARPTSCTTRPGSNS